MASSESHGAGLYRAAPVLTDFTCLETLVSQAMHVFEDYREAAVFFSPNQKQTKNHMDEATLSSEGVLGMGWSSKATSQARISSLLVLCVVPECKDT